MVMKKTKDQLIERLKRESFVFSEFSLVHEGDYSVADADWNYKDIPHLHYIHQLAEAAPSYADDDKIASIVVQKIPGFVIPLSVFIYENSPTSQLYYTASFFHILIIESVYTELGPNRTRVTTTYCVGSSKLLKWTFPILRWLIKRNYKDLMSGDIPMRERRGQLRSWGYEFHRDGATYSYVKSANIRPDNVILPVEPNLSSDAIELNLADILPEDGEYFWGREDAWGLRLVRSADKLRVFARMCHHEGALLDKQPCVDHQLQCPWHGRRSLPMAIFDLTQTINQKNISRLHQIAYSSGVMSIVLQPPSAEHQMSLSKCVTEDILTEA